MWAAHKTQSSVCPWQVPLAIQGVPRNPGVVSIEAHRICAAVAGASAHFSRCLALLGTLAFGLESFSVA